MVARNSCGRLDMAARKNTTDGVRSLRTIITPAENLCVTQYTLLSDELLRFPAELAHINVARRRHGKAMRRSGPSHVGRQFFQDLSLQIAKHPTCPEPLVLGHAQRGDAANIRPLAQKLPTRVKNLDPAVIPIGDKDPALRVHRHVVGNLKLAGSGPSLAPLEQGFSLTPNIPNAGVS